jgi:hypothetical protein
MSVSLGGDDTAERHHPAARITGLLLEGNRKDRVRLNGLRPKPSNRPGLLAWPSGERWLGRLPTATLNAEDRFLLESVSYRGS